MGSAEMYKNKILLKSTLPKFYKGEPILPLLHQQEDGYDPKLYIYYRISFHKL